MELHWGCVRYPAPFSSRRAAKKRRIVYAAQVRATPLAAVFSSLLLSSCVKGSPVRESKSSESESAPAEQAEPIEAAKRAEKKPAPSSVLPGPGPEVAPKSRQALSNGLIIEDFALGEGPEAKSGSKLTLRYAGFLEDGTVIDDNRQPSKRPFEFRLSKKPRVKGWYLGLQGMRKGGMRRVVVPSELAYGKEGAAGDDEVPEIPPNSKIVYLFKLVDLKPPPKRARGPQAFEGPVLASKKLKGGLGVSDYDLGEGPQAEIGDRVVVHYTGRLKDGTVFDSTAEGSSPLRFIVGSPLVIQGWNLGIVGMRKGALRRLEIPPKLGYGSRSLDGIPPNSKLYFTLELMKLEKASKAKKK